MGRRGTGEAGALARGVARAVASLAADAGITNQELAEASGMSISYFYKRMRGEYPYSLNDLEKLAQVLKVHPAMIAALASSDEEPVGDVSDPAVDVDRAELARRLSMLTAAPLADGTDYSWERLAVGAAENGIAFAPDDFDALRRGTFTEPLKRSWLTLIAEHWALPAAFLSDFSDDVNAEAAFAQLEFRSALRESGAGLIAARAVGEISPEALRAISASLRSIRQ